MIQAGSTLNHFASNVDKEIDVMLKERGMQRATTAEATEHWELKFMEYRNDEGLWCVRLVNSTDNIPSSNVQIVKLNLKKV